MRLQKHYLLRTGHFTRIKGSSKSKTKEISPYTKKSNKNKEGQATKQ
jgi:hypothetical protein